MQNQNVSALELKSKGVAAFRQGLMRDSKQCHQDPVLPVVFLLGFSPGNSSNTGRFYPMGAK